MKSLNRNKIDALRLGVSLTLAAALFGCTMEPDYERPESPLDAKADAIKDFKHAEGLWKEAAPADDSFKGNWWEMFGDEELNSLIKACRDKNPTLKAAFYAVEQARQRARMTESDLYPWADGHASWSKTGSSKNEYSYRGTYEDYRIGLGLTWDLDLFGRIQALVKSDVALAQAQFAAYENVMLMLETEVASTYFTIRQYNSEIKLLKNTIEVRKEQLTRIENGVSVKFNDDLDLSRAQQLYYEATSQLAGVMKARDVAANYLAYIVGSVPSAQVFTEEYLEQPLPPLPRVIPSMLLERRPDIAEMERKVFAANFRIGSATSAFFPTIQITSSLDLASADIDSLFNSGSLAWGVSPRLYMPIFQAGKLIAQREVALSEHLQIVEQYKDTVLFAIYEVESALSNIKNLEKEYADRSKVADASMMVTTLTKQKLDVGSADYFEFSDAERLSLANERERIRLRGERFRASISLIKAVGGSPSREEREAEGQKVEDETENKTAKS